MGELRLVICGATGQQGGAAVERLLARQRYRLVALTRDAASPKARALAERGVQVEQGDLLDPAALHRIFTGAHGVFGVTQPWSADYKKVDAAGEVQQGKNLIDACVKCSVKHLVLSTAMQLEDKPTGLPHLDSKQDIERHLRATPAPFTLLRPGTFIENIGLPFFAVKRGKLRGFVDSDAKLPFMSAHDVGEAAAVAFDAPDRWLEQTVDLVSDYVSGDDICRALERTHPGQRFRHTCPPRWLMRLFAPEFYKMRVGAEASGRPPFPPPRQARRRPGRHPRDGARVDVSGEVRGQR
ncbi:MAG: NmrA/HSCARG family protein [Archangiaceae bacterium]|nr:NmrA/HSCARG family protein [Archangiaceae bacterium]